MKQDFEQKEEARDGVLPHSTLQQCDGGDKNDHDHHEDKTVIDRSSSSSSTWTEFVCGDEKEFDDDDDTGDESIGDDDDDDGNHNKEEENRLWHSWWPYKTTASDPYVIRWNVLTCHIFLYQTWVALLLAILGDTMKNSTMIWIRCNFWFHVIYTFCYASFLYLYIVAPPAPNTFVITGIFLYFCGYSIFLVLFGLEWANPDRHLQTQVDITVAAAEEEDESTTRVIDALYVSGSMAFLIGSKFLVYGSYEGTTKTNTTWWVPLPWRHDAAVFWGSVCFWIGSVFFSVDSSLLVNHHRHDDDDDDDDDDETPSSFKLLATGASPLLVAGLASFAVGRIFFVWGSTNMEIGVWLQRKNQDERCMDNKSWSRTKKQKTIGQAYL